MSLASTVVDAALASPRPTQIGGDFLAQETEVNTNNLKDWIGDNVFVVIFLLVVCAIALGALKSNFSKVLTVGGLSLVAITFFVLAGSQSAMNGLGAFFLSLFGVDV
ncbi:hypothetical protein ACVH9Z_25190 [Rhodococcus opacus]|uniref:hypothetical protein n=1 Tax=Rhodococcus TaxID=1827 RepID=UPI00077A7A9F|nr:MULTISPECIES: hypothetical protein [Rhodococcus]KXX55771.1 hypothetical protein AZG88_17365 [Rhodococcus sp. LB1]MDJ0419613.1 hypothetical protein [Rhodococcus opacus]MDV7088225.1 hypothetical protein [Rhodococcus opacus]WKN52591.1 hypothetical protein HJ581_0001340 [Rhodococcus opacus]